MNIESVAQLASELRVLGFGITQRQLMRRICLRPKTFSITHAVMSENHRVLFNLFFERAVADDAYVLQYYDASVHAHVRFTDSEVNGVLISALNEQMAAIDWKEAFSQTDSEAVEELKALGWDTEIKLDAIMGDLERLQQTNEGKELADNLRLKHWKGTGYQQVFQNLMLPKDKSEVGQRFYCLDGQSTISVGEACRFLKNRKLEKEMLANRKPVQQNEQTETDAGDAGGKGNGLLKKRRGRLGVGSKR